MQSMLFQPVTTGIPSFFTTLVNTSNAFPIRIPFPALITGRFASRTFFKISLACSTVTGSGSFTRFSPCPLTSDGIIAGFPSILFIMQIVHPEHPVPCPDQPVPPAS